jgi:hypothetical protein
MKRLVTFLILIIPLVANSQENNFPKEINSVFNYLLKKDYPEKFGEQVFQLRPVRWQIIDIDDNGTTEVFLQTFPHYRQSPTISIFCIDKNDSVNRVIEGFAPGHLLPLSQDDDYLDTHSTGTAIDSKLDSNDPDKFKKLANASLQFGMSVVLYENFIHMDKREGSGVFIDLMYLKDFPDENSCKNFQFDFPDQIIAGKIENEDKKYFVAKCSDEFFCYKIIGFEDNKYINKEISIIKVPKDFTKLILDNGFIKYENKKGRIMNLD